MRDYLCVMLQEPETFKVQDPFPGDGLGPSKPADEDEPANPTALSSGSAEYIERCMVWW